MAPTTAPKVSDLNTVLAAIERFDYQANTSPRQEYFRLTRREVEALGKVAPVLRRAAVKVDREVTP